MGPWLCSHGNDVYKDYRVVRLYLQWGRGCVATEIGIRKWRDFVAGMALQWGRGCVATEIWLRSRQDACWCAPSMGPWLCSHGNRRVRSSSASV